MKYLPLFLSKVNALRNLCYCTFRGSQTFSVAQSGSMAEAKTTRSPWGAVPCKSKLIYTGWFVSSGYKGLEKGFYSPHLIFVIESRARFDIKITIKWLAISIGLCFFIYFYFGPRILQYSHTFLLSYVVYSGSCL